jgi:hypothetical protein
MSLNLRNTWNNYAKAMLTIEVEVKILPICENSSLKDWMTQSNHHQNFYASSEQQSDF